MDARHGRTSAATFITTWSESRNTASIGKRMKAVWIDEARSSRSPSPSSRPLRPSRPRIFESDELATTQRSHTGRPSTC